ncbi:DUF1294 domain-containing protein [Paraglaciecola sp.]|uniref:DUF1294 domain-containing protein n=1 Tax=Paraglaciecola sp. TaxID=1920173 RepID=UPI00274023C9|nr:DUF1294 domain-containing protein [Paraglaciecola sp.]MDP5029462.1 DUF1294 domain-containing protein [Paraglaciecola sp.]
MRLWFTPILLLSIGLMYSFWNGYTPLLLCVVYLFASVVSYFLYAKDKRAATKGTWRVPEKNLHISSLLAGWPGSIIAQHTLRHKTQKTSFKVVFVIMLFLNLCLLIWFHSSSSARLFHSAHNRILPWVKEHCDISFCQVVIPALLELHRSH